MTYHIAYCLRLLCLAGVIALAGCANLANPQRVEGAKSGSGPAYAVDPYWPKPLPNQWLLGQVAGIATDKNQTIWVIHRPNTLTDDERGATLKPPRSTCCLPALAVLQFDQAGN